MPQFDAKSAGRISKSVRYTERQRRNIRSQRARWFGSSPPVHWGKLDANLLYDDTTGVTVTIWSGNPLADSGRDIENVLPPPVLASGQLDSGDWVKIERIDGRWYVTAAPC